MIRFELWPLFQGEMRIAKIKSAHNSLIHVPRGCHTYLLVTIRVPRGCHNNLLEIMG